MKVFKRKERSTLSLMPVAGGGANSDLSTGILNESSHGWLHVVTTVPHGSVVKATLAADAHKGEALSAEDFIRVNRATIRESDMHRFWPRHVIGKFLVAEVVANRAISHYVVHDSNLTRKLS